MKNPLVLGPKSLQEGAPQVITWFMSPSDCSYIPDKTLLHQVVSQLSPLRASMGPFPVVYI